MSNFTVKIVKDINQAKELWNQLSPNETIYDSWDFRYCFYKYFNYELFFYVGYVDGRPIGMLPLQWNTVQNHLEQFGGSFMYDARIFIEEGFQKFIPFFYDQIDRPAKIVDISGEDDFTISLPFSDYKYILNLTEINTVEMYLEKLLVSKYRTNIRRRIKIIKNENFTIKHNDVNDLSMLVDLNLKSFSDSSFQKPFRREIFYDLVRGSFGTQLLSFVYNDEIMGVSLSFSFKKTYYYINLGIDKKASPHLWTFITLSNIENAIGLGDKVFDAGVGNFDWKEHWGCEKIPQYKFEKNETNYFEI